MSALRHLTRRQALQLLASSVPALAARGAFAQKPWPITPGKYAGTRASLATYEIPEWFADAKFGIWSHWGPQSAVGDGDWYARNMYMEGSAQYEYHVKRFGPQSKFGYKDCIPLFTADKWDPEHLMDLYQKAGAKYFFSMGVHHDGFDMWNSKYQPRWNAVAAGPHKDVVGLWAAAARKRGLRFGVSEHLSNSYDWFSPAHLADTKGPYAGIPYDGQNPAFADLYHDYTGQPADFLTTAKAMGRNPSEKWKREYFNRVKDLVDQYQPDLLYTDGGIVYEELGLSLVAEEYNAGPLGSHGEAEGIYFGKTPADCATGTCVLDRERTVSATIWPTPWQTDTCIGSWHYKVGQNYKTSKKVIDMLVDIVSKNGNLLLNFPLPASGELDAEEVKVLAGITAWMERNGEGIFSTRPWTVNGEGPAMQKQAAVISDGGFHPNESKQPDLGAEDIRFTTKGKTLYALVQGWPAGELVVTSLSTNSAAPRATDVRLLGRDQPLRFTQDTTGLRVKLPEEKPVAADIGIGLRINFV
jgi:alpha-L-fucosidase